MISLQELGAHMIAVGKILIHETKGEHDPLIRKGMSANEVINVINEDSALLSIYIQYMIENGVEGERAEDLIQIFASR
jgi:hypothetical protein